MRIRRGKRKVGRATAVQIRCQKFEALRNPKNQWPGPANNLWTTRNAAEVPPPDSINTLLGIALQELVRRANRAVAVSHGYRLPDGGLSISG